MRDWGAKTCIDLDTGPVFFVCTGKYCIHSFEEIENSWMIMAKTSDSDDDRLVHDQFEQNDRTMMPFSL